MHPTEETQSLWGILGLFCFVFFLSLYVCFEGFLVLIRVSEVIFLSTWGNFGSCLVVLSLRQFCLIEVLLFLCSNFVFPSGSFVSHCGHLSTCGSHLGLFEVMFAALGEFGVCNSLFSVFLWLFWVMFETLWGHFLCYWGKTVSLWCILCFLLFCVAF